MITIDISHLKHDTGIIIVSGEYFHKDYVKNRGEIYWYSIIVLYRQTLFEHRFRARWLLQLRCWRRTWAHMWLL